MVTKDIYYYKRCVYLLQIGEVNNFLIELLNKTKLRKPISSANKRYYPIAATSRGDGTSAANSLGKEGELAIQSILSFNNQKQNNIIPGSNPSNNSTSTTITYINTENSMILTAENDNKLII